MFLKGNLTNLNLSLEIIDARGRIMLQKELRSNEEDINISSISKGVYLLILRNETEVLYQETTSVISKLINQMKQLNIIILFQIASIFFAIGQQVSTLTFLDETVSETSGIVYLNGRLITHNDSGGNSALYEIDSITGAVTRTVTIEDASNVDWEDICVDDTYIYIADIGNNNGTRTDLRIYKILISDYLNNEVISAEKIEYNYSDQTNFTSNPFNTNFDAETLIAYNDSLYIFTKNWGDNRTNVYSIPKTPGNYSVNRIDNFWTNGIITGGTYNVETQKIVLTGMALIFPFIVEIDGIEGNQFSDANRKRYMISVDNAIQIESIDRINAEQYYLTAESGAGGDATLYLLEIDEILSAQELTIEPAILYPNPASSSVRIETKYLDTVKIYDQNGALEIEAYKNEIDISKLAKGTYIVLIQSKNNQAIDLQKLVIQ